MWSGATLKERSTAQEHFTNLCRALSVPTPAEVDPNGTFSVFDKGTAKTARFFVELTGLSGGVRSATLLAALSRDMRC